MFRNKNNVRKNYRNERSTMWYFEHANCKCNINEKCEFKVVKLISMTFEISSAFSTLGNELRNLYTCI